MDQPENQLSPRMGRPPNPIELRRRNRVVTMVTDSQAEELSQLAERQDCSISTLIHSILRQHFDWKRK